MGFFKPLLLCIFLGTFLLAKKDLKKHFKLPPAKGGAQTGWLDVERLPTSIKINDEWVLPRGGTVEYFMSKGYVPDSEDPNIMRPNPYDKRYKDPKPRHLPSLATSPIQYFYVPKPEKSNDPFEGLADPIKKNFSPLLDVGINDNPENLDNPGGPLLKPTLPKLDNSPFAEPNLPIAENPNLDPFNKPQKPKLPPNDPFGEDVRNESKPKLDPNKLPGKNIPIAPKAPQAIPTVKPNA